MHPIKILLLGGHGKISLLLTRQLLSSASQPYHITSVVRNSDHMSEVEKVGVDAKKGGGNEGSRVEVVVESLEDCKGVEDARRVVEGCGAEWVVWSAGAGGKPPVSRTFSIDRNACKYYITASFQQYTVRKFLLVSYALSRRNKPDWWTDSDWQTAQESNNTVLKNYYAAKVEADEWLAATAAKNRNVQAICLRPGTLTDGPKIGKVILGHTRARGNIRRADVADVAVRLLERADSKGWIDLLGVEEGDKEKRRVRRWRGFVGNILIVLREKIRTGSLDWWIKF